MRFNWPEYKFCCTSKSKQSKCACSDKYLQQIVKYFAY